MHPEQVVHLQNAGGDKLSVPLSALSGEHLATATEALVYDDEGYGLRLLDRRPLDRVGPTFKVTVGSMFEPPPATAPHQQWESGIASTIQIGLFPVQSVGLLGSLSLAGGSDTFGRTFQRHAVGGELQVFPLRLGRFSLGAFGHGGVQLVGDSENGLSSGPAVGGGLLMELALTTRLAFSVRGDWTAARPEKLPGWIGNGTITAGLAIY